MPKFEQAVETGNRGGARSSASGAARKKSGSVGSSALKSIVASAASSDALLDLVERLGLVELVMGRVKARVEETDIDELFEDVKDYLKRNPDVLVVSLAAITVATGVVVYLNNRREWNGSERRGVEKPKAKSRKRANNDD